MTTVGQPFWVRVDDREPKIERGGVTFDLCCRPLEQDKDFSGKARHRVSYYGERGIQEVISAVSLLMGPAFRAHEHTRALQSVRHGAVKPPVRLEAAGCRWTLTTNDLRLWMPNELALSLRANLDEYDPEG